MSKTVYTPDSFYSLFAVGRMLGVPKDTISHFDPQHSPTVLSPIAHLFVCFHDGDRQTWAIRKKYFDKWRTTGIAPKKNPGRTRKYPPGTKHINIPAPAFYDKFVAGIQKCNRNSTTQVTIQDFIYIAMKEAMDRRPNIFGDDVNG